MGLWAAGDGGGRLQAAAEEAEAERVSAPSRVVAEPSPEMTAELQRQGLVPGFDGGPTRSRRRRAAPSDAPGGRPSTAAGGRSPQDAVFRGAIALEGAAAAILAGGGPALPPRRAGAPVPPPPPAAADADDAAGGSVRLGTAQPTTRTVVHRREAAATGALVGMPGTVAALADPATGGWGAAAATDLPPLQAPVRVGVGDDDDAVDALAPVPPPPPPALRAGDAPPPEAVAAAAVPPVPPPQALRAASVDAGDAAGDDDDAAPRPASAGPAAPPRAAGSLGARLRAAAFQARPNLADKVQRETLLDRFRDLIPPARMLQRLQGRSGALSPDQRAEALAYMADDMRANPQVIRTLLDTDSPDVLAAVARAMGQDEPVPGESVAVARTRLATAATNAGIPEDDDADFDDAARQRVSATLRERGAARADDYAVSDRVYVAAHEARAVDALKDGDGAKVTRTAALSSQLTDPAVLRGVADRLGADDSSATLVRAAALAVGQEPRRPGVAGLLGQRNAIKAAVVAAVAEGADATALRTKRAKALTDFAPSYRDDEPARATPGGGAAVAARVGAGAGVQQAREEAARVAAGGGAPGDPGDPGGDDSDDDAARRRVDGDTAGRPRGGADDADDDDGGPDGPGRRAGAAAAAAAAAAGRGAPDAAAAAPGEARTVTVDRASIERYAGVRAGQKGRRWALAGAAMGGLAGAIAAGVAAGVDKKQRAIAKGIREAALAQVAADDMGERATALERALVTAGLDPARAEKIGDKGLRAMIRRAEAQDSGDGTKEEKQARKDAALDAVAAAVDELQEERDQLDDLNARIDALGDDADERASLEAQRDRALRANDQLMALARAATVPDGVIGNDPETFTAVARAMGIIDDDATISMAQLVGSKKEMRQAIAKAVEAQELETAAKQTADQEAKLAGEVARLQRQVDDLKPKEGLDADALGERKTKRTAQKRRLAEAQAALEAAKTKRKETDDRAKRLREAARAQAKTVTDKETGGFFGWLKTKLFGDRKGKAKEDVKAARPQPPQTRRRPVPAVVEAARVADDAEADGARPLARTKPRIAVSDDDDDLDRLGDEEARVVDDPEDLFRDEATDDQEAAQARFAASRDRSDAVRDAAQAVADLDDDAVMRELRELGVSTDDVPVASEQRRLMLAEQLAAQPRAMPAAAEEDVVRPVGGFAPVPVDTTDRSLTPAQRAENMSRRRAEQAAAAKANAAEAAAAAAGARALVAQRADDDDDEEVAPAAPPRPRGSVTPGLDFVDPGTRPPRRAPSPPELDAEDDDAASRVVSAAAASAAEAVPPPARPADGPEVTAAAAEALSQRVAADVARRAGADAAQRDAQAAVLAEAAAEQKRHSVALDAEAAIQRDTTAARLAAVRRTRAQRGASGSVQQLAASAAALDEDEPVAAAPPAAANPRLAGLAARVLAFQRGQVAAQRQQEAGATEIAALQAQLATAEAAAAAAEGLRTRAEAAEAARDAAVSGGDAVQREVVQKTAELEALRGELERVRAVKNVALDAATTATRGRADAQRGGGLTRDAARTRAMDALVTRGGVDAAAADASLARAISTQSDASLSRAAVSGMERLAAASPTDAAAARRAALKAAATFEATMRQRAGSPDASTLLQRVRAAEPGGRVQRRTARAGRSGS